MKKSPTAFWIAPLILCTAIASAQVWPDVDASLEMSTDGTTWNAISPGLIEVSASETHFRTVLTPIGGGSPVAGEPVTELFPTGNGAVQVSLDRSDDLSTWAAIAPGTESVDPKVFLRVETNAAMSLIPAGVFMMGSDPAELGRDTDEVLHEVTLTRSFYVQQTEVTKAQWDAVTAQGDALGYTDLSAGRNGFEGDPSGRHPVTEVTWFSVLKWLNLLSELDGLTPCYTLEGEPYKTGVFTPECNFHATGYRLPTEAEWEYFCRAGTTTAFYNGPITYINYELDPNLDLIGWYGGNEAENTHPVGEKQANPWGLFDTSGNVFEWCWDWYDAYDGDVSDPTGPLLSTGDRVIRGGNFFNNAFQCRSAYRNLLSPGLGAYSIGFRPVRTVSP